MPFFGAIEAFTRRRIAGWARCEEGGTRLPIRFELRLRGHPPLAPARLTDRGEGTGFAFDLPETLHHLPWHDLVDSFEAVAALSEGTRRWTVPMYKSVLLAPDLAAAANPTTLLADELHPYATAPRPGGRVAALTLAQGDPLALTLWARHHAAHFGAGNLYVLDPTPPAEAAALPDGVTRIHLPAAPGEGWPQARTLALFQRFLLESHDAVLCTEPDALLCAAPGLAAGRSLAETLLALPQPLAAPTAWRLWHDIESEPEYDPARPLLAQRRILVREPALDRPLVTRIPANWRPGLRASDPVHPVEGLHLLQLRTFDLDHALAELPRRTGGATTPGIIAGWFRAEARAFAQATIMGFDPQAPRTMAASWMLDQVRA